MMKKILIIEDDTSTRTVIQDVLEIAGYQCQTAPNGRKGVEAAQTFLPDLIVSDVMMPLLDGFGVLLELQQNPQTAMIPFIFLTGQTDKEDIRRGMSLGADDYLFKPFTHNELLTAVETRLGKHERLTSSRVHELKSYLNVTLPHELRTPLAGIMGYLDMLKNDYASLDGQMVQSMVDRMSVSADRLYHLIENYLMFAQMAVTLQDQALINELRADAVCEFTKGSITFIAEKKAEAHSRTADLVLDNIHNHHLRIYPENLEKIVGELVDNAFKFSPAGTPVTLQTAVDNNRYQLIVSDEGHGMTAEQIASVGENQQFNRAQYEQQGVGLGLAIIQRVCIIFGGEFKVEGNPQGGLTATISLPLYQLPQTPPPLNGRTSIPSL